MGNTWYSYECRENCSPPTGVIIDTRLPKDSNREAPKIECPVCKSTMDFRGIWAATEAGFGSSGNSPPLIVFPRHFKSFAKMIANTLQYENLIPPEDYEKITDKINNEMICQLDLQHDWNETGVLTNVKMNHP